MAAKYKDVSVTIHGAFYYFAGPHGDGAATPSSFPRGNGNRYVKIGEGQAWYRYHNDNGYIYLQRSGNFHKEYPSLSELITDKKLFSSPTCLSLGPNETYFFAIDGWQYYKLPDSIKSGVDMDEVKKMWLGKDGSYVALKNNGGFYWDFKNHYPGLAKWLNDRISKAPVKDLALDLVSGVGWIAVWEDEYLYFNQSISDTFDKETLKNWGSANFGLTWSN